MNSAETNRNSPPRPGQVPANWAPPLGEFGAAAFGGLILLLGLHFVWLPDVGLARWAPSVATYMLGALAVGALFRQTFPHATLGLCNIVTLTRFVLVAFLVTPLAFGVGSQSLVFWVAAIALAMDGVDGWFARRSGLASACGARFDMEVDGALSVTLAVGALWTDLAGPAVLILGLTRYVFVAATMLLPWLAAPLPDRFSRKAVCVLQLGTLIALHLPLVPRPLGGGLVAVASLALIWSFGRDIRWLWQARA